MIFGNRRAAALLRELPWLETRTPSAFMGFHIVIVEKGCWGTLPGLEETLRQFDEPSILPWDLTLFDDSNRLVEDELRQISFPRATGACVSQRRGYGMIPSPDSYGARFVEGEGTEGYVLLVPRERYPDQRPIYRYEIADAVFEGAGVGAAFYAFDPNSDRLYDIGYSELWMQHDSARLVPRLLR